VADIGKDNNEMVEKLKEDWHLAGYRIEQIGEFVDKVRRFQYRSRLKKGEKSLRKYENALYSLFFDINLYIQVRSHVWSSYGYNEVKSEEDIKEEFEKANKLIKKSQYNEAFEILENIDRIVNYARIKEGFDIPNQVSKFDPSQMATDQRSK